MRYDAAIFDMDGTILNTLDDLAASTNAALGCFGLPERTTDEVRRFVGNGIERLIKRACPPRSDERLLKAVYDEFCAHYQAHDSVRTAPYPGIMETLDELAEHGVGLAVVSNKGDFAVQDLARRFFPGVFGFAVGEREHIRRKPAPDSVFAALEALGVSPERAVYVGDSEVDVQTAAAAGIPCISCTWGFRGVDELVSVGATTFVDAPSELIPAIIGQRSEAAARCTRPSRSRPSDTYFALTSPRRTPRIGPAKTVVLRNPWQGHHSDTSSALNHSPAEPLKPGSAKIVRINKIYGRCNPSPRSPSPQCLAPTWPSTQEPRMHHAGFLASLMSKRRRDGSATAVRPDLVLALAQGGVEGAVVELLLDGLAMDEGDGQELIERRHERTAVDVVVLMVAVAGVLRSPCLEVDVGEVVELVVNAHVHRVVVMQVLDQPVVIDVEWLSCPLAHTQVLSSKLSRTN